MPRGRKKGVRFEDIAAHAKVGIATVDRVLNERGNVSPRTVKQVLDAARDLGLNRHLPELYSSHRRYRAIIARKRAPFSVHLSEALHRAAQLHANRVILERNFVAHDDASRTANEILATAEDCDGLLIVPFQDQIVQAAVDEVSSKIPVVTLVSDLQGGGRHAFVGTDNRMAGRTAAVMLGTALREKGTILIFWSGHGYSGQKERVDACRMLLQREFSGLVVEDRVLSVATRSETISRARNAIDETSDLVAVYDAGVADAAVSLALEAEGRGEDVICVAHELTDISQDLLRRRVIDYVIDQNPEQIARTGLECLMRLDGLLSEGALESMTDFRIYCRANLPDT